MSWLTPLSNTLESVAIDLLIGSDYFWNIVGGIKVMLPSGMFMLPSKFGYIITGKCPDTREYDKSCTPFVSTEVGQIVPELCLQYSATTPAIENPRLEDLWCLENIGISDSPFVNNDDEALKRRSSLMMAVIKLLDHGKVMNFPYQIIILLL